MYVYNFDSIDNFYVRKLNPLEERKIRKEGKYGIVKNGKVFYLLNRDDSLAMEIIKKYINDQIIELNNKINRLQTKKELCNDFNNIKFLKEHSYNKEYYERCLIRDSIKKN
jgi:hypothetical protein